MLERALHFVVGAAALHAPRLAVQRMGRRYVVGAHRLRHRDGVVVARLGGGDELLGEALRQRAVGGLVLGDSRERRARHGSIATPALLTVDVSANVQVAVPLRLLRLKPLPLLGLRGLALLDAL